MGEQNLWKELKTGCSQYGAPIPVPWRGLEVCFCGPGEHQRWFKEGGEECLLSLMVHLTQQGIIIDRLEIQDQCRVLVHRKAKSYATLVFDLIF